MERSTLGWIAAFLLAVGGAAVVWVFFLAGGSGEPSTALTTPDIVTTTADATSGDPGLSSSTSTSEPEGGESATFLLDASETVATFQLDEMLRGQPTTVVGTTDQVAGQVRVDLRNLSESTFSDIVINARTFTTDSEQRNRAIRGPVVLDSASDEHELIVFTPASIGGVEGVAAVVGESYRFTIDGDLTIKGSTIPVTFQVVVDMADESSISGVATGEVLRSDFGIGIPSVPFVADVSDEVLLTLEFVARSG